MTMKEEEVNWRSRPQTERKVNSESSGLENGQRASLAEQVCVTPFVETARALQAFSASHTSAARISEAAGPLSPRSTYDIPLSSTFGQSGRGSTINGRR